MTISSDNNRDTYVGNGNVDTYDYSFKVFDQTELVVKVRDTDDVETTLTLTTDYTVTGVGSADGGTVALVNASQDWLDGGGDLEVNYVLTIRRVLPLTQETDIRNQGDYYPEGTEDEFDKQVMIDQQQQDDIDRSVKLPETIDPADFDPTLPADLLTNGVSMIPSTNASGDGWALAADWTPVTDLTAAVTAASAAATSASAASASAAAAVVSASAASASATAAASSATSASGSATAAAASAVAAAASSSAATNVVVGSHASPTSIVAGTGVPAPTAGRCKIYVKGTGGVDITKDPQIAAGTSDGDGYLIVGTSDTDTVLLENGTGLRMDGPCTLIDGSQIRFNWDAGQSLWVEEFRNDF